MQNQIIEVKQIDWFDERFYKIRYENEAKVEVEDYFPSVTTKLGALPKPQLLHWYGDIGNREANLRRNEAADSGSRVHWAWQTYCTAGIVIYNPPKAPIYDEEEIKELKEKYNQHFFMLYNQDEMWSFMKLVAFYQAVKPYKMLSEHTVYDIDNRDAGTMDNLFGIPEGEYMINGSKPVKLARGLYLFDAKTGNYIGNDSKMQLAAYWGCIMFMIRNGLIDLPEKEEDRNIVGAIIGHTAAKTRSGIEGFSATVLNVDDLQEYYKRYRNIAAVWESEFGTLKPTIRQVPGYITL